jgi:hypothetical protein
MAEYCIEYQLDNFSIDLATLQSLLGCPSKAGTPYVRYVLGVVVFLLLIPKIYGSMKASRIM